MIVVHRHSLMNRVESPFLNGLSMSEHFLSAYFPVHLRIFANEQHPIIGWRSPLGKSVIVALLSSLWRREAV